MSSPQWQTQVVPARLSFLAIYNPSLGPTDETFADQLVYYYSRSAHEARIAAKKHARSDAAAGDAQREEQNEQLRQIGLAQGMVDFARSFTNGKTPVDSIDTEKSRIVLHELEPGWWMLASIDLTQLPAAAPSSAETAKKSGTKIDSKPAIEYSAREVSPPALLLQQLIQAHYIFMLHHGPSFDELFVRMARDKFCGALDRYWTRFARTWDVLLHGNPAADVFGGIKLSSGGELGIGVGEEEWGSGERDVLEDLTRRTVGLVDLVVSRFGEAPPAKDDAAVDDNELLPWMGSGSQPVASDGVIFGGVGAITRPTLRSVSLWMRQIYTYGDHAYGVRDNPLRPRQKRKRRVPPPQASNAKSNGKASPSKASGEAKVRDSQSKPSSERSAGRKPTHRPNYTGQDSYEQRLGNPGIPPPIATAVERSLDKASKQADADAAKAEAQSEDAGTTLGIPDQYMKYLTFGLSTFAKSSNPSRPEPPRRTSTASSKTMTTKRYAASNPPPLPPPEDDDDDEELSLAQVDPIPDGEPLEARIAKQKRMEETGHFVIGLRGDLSSIDESDSGIGSDGDDEFSGLRSVLRTVQVELNDTPSADEDKTELQKKLSEAGLSAGRNDRKDYRRLRVLVYVHRPFMYCFLFEDRTPSLSVAGFFKELHHNLLPIHKPLLSSTSVARVAQRIEETQVSSPTDGRQSDAMSMMSSLTQTPSKKSKEPTAIHDLIYDPALLTVHTSVPNIPEPGTSAAEGIISGVKTGGINSPSLWTRIEALNVHSQILNTISSVQRNPHEYERTSKTTRNWWVVWMKLSPSSPAETLPDTSRPPPSGDAKPTPATLRHEDSNDSNDTNNTASTDPTSIAMEKAVAPPLNRIAILVRKASDAVAPPPKSTSRAASSMWNSLSLRSNSTSDEITGGASAGWGPAALAGGIGIDARKYVEGLLSLNR
ncbi:hypothetical protein TI39_contig497g00006 [Zymoseptoria brevis]|uniref:CCZ1/INTU/HSP4 first Longin domain-containing protein n=1 Tax=Zymoseptoria brevis TaxID=1047168 RepID=A0A0F4GJ36_9PEZI|nr:hypothetical protein TI39_contig497g00006 [Zymoseptoria brevis]